MVEAEKVVGKQKKEFREYFAANAKQHGATFPPQFPFEKNFTHVSRVKWQSFLTTSRLQMQSVKNGIEFFPFFSFATWESKK